MNLFDLSLRFKLPLWSGLLIILTATVVSVSLLRESYLEVKEDLRIASEVLARALAPNLTAPLLEGDSDRASNVISDTADDHMINAENILVADASQRVFAVAPPTLSAKGRDVGTISAEYAAVAEHARHLANSAREAFTPRGTTHLFQLTPIVRSGKRLGTLVIKSDFGNVMPRFTTIALNGLLAGGLILAVLLPLNWYWGYRMSLPISRLATRMGELSSNQVPANVETDLYPHKDELGQLFLAYNQMVHELQLKEELEKQVVQAERLAALGQLASGVAHEINNPLGGMLTALDTLKSHRNLDPLTEKTIDLLERGLTQIKDTVNTLLVEARLKNRPLSASDIEDVRILVAPQIRKKAVSLTWRNNLAGEVKLPATLVRQILINLLLNAVKAAGHRGDVNARVSSDATQLEIVVTNNGRSLTAEQMSHLFEPFSPLSDTGHGLGLWVTYQIVRQLGGEIGATSEQGYVCFTVKLPIGEQLL